MDLDPFVSSPSEPASGEHVSIENFLGYGKGLKSTHDP